MRYLKNKKPTLLHYCSHCRKNFSARSRSAQYSARYTAGSVQLEQRAVHGGVRIVPELISFDDLRDKFLPPGRGPGRPITEIESEFQRLAA